MNHREVESWWLMIQPKDLVFLTDFYEFSMAYTYFQENKHEDVVVFDMFARKIPNNGGYMIFNGLNKLIESLQSFKFETAHIEYLRSQGFTDQRFLDYLLNMSLSLDIWSVEDGTVVFPNEPWIVVKGKVIEAQLIETLLLLSINYPTLISTKASRIVHAAKGHAVLEFGARRAHGYDASLEGARAALIAGVVATSHTLTGERYGGHVSGTMAHSFIQMYDNEYEAFKAYATIHPDNAIFLVDTYDTLASGVPNAIRVYEDVLKPLGKTLKAIRLDSGDLAYLSKRARIMLDEAGLQSTQIMASNSLDETLIDDLLYQGAKIDAFGVGENLITSKTEPVLGGVYKFVAAYREDIMIPKIKVSNNIEKITNPGHKKLYRFYDRESGKALADYIALVDEIIPTQEITIFDPLAPWRRKTLTQYTVRDMHTQIMSQGNIVYETPSLDETRLYAKKELDTLWEESKRIHYPHEYYVDLSQKLYDLKLQLLHDASEEKRQIKSDMK